MTLSPIGDIGVSSLTESAGTGSLTWETATDWNNAPDEKSVVHEAYGDLPGEDVVQLGQPTTLADLEFLLPFDADSTGSFADVTGNGYDPTNVGSGVSAGVTGLNGSTAASGDGSSSGVADIPRSATIDQMDGFTLFFFLKSTDSSSNQITEKRETDGSGGNSRARKWRLSGNGSGQIAYGIEDNDSVSFGYEEGTYDDGNWHSVAMVEEPDGSGGADYYGYFDGSPVNSGNVMFSTSSPPTTDEKITLWHRRKDGGGDDSYWNGTFDYFMLFPGVAKSASFISDLHDVISTGYIETATKSFNSSTQPDLQNLSYSLNGQAIDLKVIGSPGTGDEEVVTQTLDGSSSYSLTWSSAHTDFRLRPEIDTTDPTATPTFDRGELA